MQLSQEQVVLHLSLIDGIGPAIIGHLISSQSTRWQWSDLYDLSLHTWMNDFGLTQRIAGKIVTGLRDTKQLEQELQYIKKHNVQWITGINEEYPSLLSQIHLPPPVLYWQGMPLEKNATNIAAIGSRNANYYGERVINKIVPDLVAQNWTIVSGGALGADSMAHRAALASNGKTIVVLGSGLLHWYPRSNQRLFDEIIVAGGTIVSSFSMNTQPKPGNFPARNRIIAGLSYGCIVVQAAQKSGARITAQYALEQGREVFAVPGPVDDELSIGCHELIKEGATLVSCVDDIRQELELIVPRKTSNQVSEYTKKSQLEEKEQEVINETDIQVGIIRLCATPCSIDELIQKTALNLTVLQEELIKLQFDGKIQQDFTGRWLVL